MNVRVFYRQSPLENAPSVETHAEVFDVKKELAGLKEELKTTKNEQEKLNLKRKIARLESFNNLQEGKIKLEKSEEIQSILKGKTTENYLGSDLHMLRKRGVDIASLTLVSETNPSQPANSSEMKKDDKFVVNFGGNQSLARKIGAWDILPPEVTKVKINGVDCERRNIPRPGYYNDSMKPSYQKIYDGYSIEIVERANSVTAEELGAANSAAEKRWEKIRVLDTVENGGNALTQLDEDAQLQKRVQEEIEFQKKYWSISFDINNLSTWDRGLLDFIGIAEWTWSNYNAIYGNGKQSEEKFTEMTLDEVLNYQGKYKIWRWSAAIGRYQFMDYTLRSMMQRYDISGSTIFSPETQDKLAFLKLNERWLNSFKNWYITKEEFQMNLAQEWASIAKDASWLSYYHGDSMNNHASAAWKETLAVLDKIYQV